MFRGVDYWFADLRAWIEVASDQDLDPMNPIKSVVVHGDGLQILTVEGKTTSLPSRPSSIEITVGGPGAVSLRRLRRVLAKLKTSDSPSDAHLLVRDARADLRRGRYRKAVIDAGSATEVVLADLNRRGPQIQTGPRPTLGWFVTQPAIAQAALLPPTTKSELVEVRNDAIHKNVVPSAATARRAVALAREIVNRVDPLGL